MTNSYSGDPADSSKDAVRFWIQDTASPWLFSDEEIEFALTKYGAPLATSAALCETAAAQFARLCDKSVGDLRISYSQRQQAYLNLAGKFRADAVTENMTVYIGGVSKSDVTLVSQNSDRIKPPFRETQFDYFPKVLSEEIDNDDDQSFNS